MLFCRIVPIYFQIRWVIESFSSMNRAQMLVWTIVRIIQESIDFYLHACFFFLIFLGDLQRAVFVRQRLFLHVLHIVNRNPHAASSVGTTSYCPATLVAASFGGVKWASSWGIQKQNMHGILSILPVHIYILLLFNYSYTCEYILHVTWIWRHVVISL